MSYKKIYIELTNKCNLNCTICYRRSWNEKPNDMLESMIDKIYTEVKEKKIEVVLGGIGEPTFSPYIQKTIELFKNHQLTITTNGTLLDEELRKTIIGKVNKIVVSIDGLDDKFQEIRGFEFEKILGNLYALNDLKLRNAMKSPQIIIEFVCSKDNIYSIFGILDLASDLRATSVIVSNLIPQNLENCNKILYTRYENNYLKELFNMIRIHSFRKGINVILPNIELKTERRCNFIDSESVVISAEGNITSCYRFLHDTTEYVFGRKKEVKKFSFGSINNTPIENIYSSTQYINFRKTIYNNLYPSCIDCDLVDGCDLVRTSEVDCHTITPSCADCVWNRKFTICP